MAHQRYEPDWLKGYASDIYQWQPTLANGGQPQTFIRRLGVVESLFDNDGVHYEGRADMNVDLRLELRTKKDAAAVREHITLVWSVLRHQHTLMSAIALNSGEHGGDRAFLYRQPLSLGQLIEEGIQHVAYLGDHYRDVDQQDFYQHLMNSSRAIDAGQALSKLFVLPFEPSRETSFTICFVMVLAHQISDGLTLFRWTSSFIDLLNLPTSELHRRARTLINTTATPRLPPPQEALYHPTSSSIARQRWFWAIARILRHVKRPSPPCFPNPLRRARPLLPAEAFPPKYASVINYNITPPLNNHTISPTLGPISTVRLLQLCRHAHISIGSGLFTLVGMVMMLFYERQRPDVPLDQRLPFIGSFPVNPRPFLAGPTTTGQESSLMLAFSEGIVLPFLPSDLGTFQARFRLLGKQAHRQLRQYQKRPRSAEEELHLGSKSPSLLFPLLYMSCMERLDSFRPSHLRKGYNIQGAYPASTGGGLATCGVSSVGDRTKMVAAGKYDTSVKEIKEGQEVIADFRHINSAVRARDGEFLCGAASDKEKTYFMISVDSCAIDPEKAMEFQKVIENILDVNGDDHNEDKVVAKL